MSSEKNNVTPLQLAAGKHITRFPEGGFNCFFLEVGNSFEIVKSAAAYNTNVHKNCPFDIIFFRPRAACASRGLTIAIYTLWVSLSIRPRKTMKAVSGPGE